MSPIILIYSIVDTRKWWSKKVGTPALFMRCLTQLPGGQAATYDAWHTLTFAAVYGECVCVCLCLCVCVIKCNTWIIYTMHPGLSCNEIEDNFAKAFQHWASVHIAKLHQLLVRAERTFVWMANIVFVLSSISGEGYNVNDFTSWAICGNYKNLVFTFLLQELEIRYL